MPQKTEPVGAPDVHFFFPADGSEVWLSRVDAEVVLALLEINSKRWRDRTAQRVLEIGVWKGAWTSVVLVNSPGAHVLGVDPYPGSNGPIRGTMQKRLEELRVDDRFRLTADSESITPDQRFDVVHIDGEHSESAAWSDLTLALDHLAPGGLIIVDDYRHPHFPGIASALFRFIERNDVRVFLVTPNKAYLARAIDAPTYHDELLTYAAGFRNLRLRRHFGDGLEPVAYSQPTDVLGQPVLLAEKIHHVAESGIGRGAGASLRRAGRAVTPPVLLLGYRVARRRWRMARQR